MSRRRYIPQDISHRTCPTGQISYLTDRGTSQNGVAQNGFARRKGAARREEGIVATLALMQRCRDAEAGAGTTGLAGGLGPTHRGGKGEGGRGRERAFLDALRRPGSLNGARDLGSPRRSA